MDCRGNLIHRGLTADMNVMPQSLSKLPQDCVRACDYTVFGCTVQRRKTTIAHTSGAAQWTPGSRCDTNEDCRHLRGSCSHKTPRSSLSAQMYHSGGPTAQRGLPHGWVRYTYWKSIAIFQWQRQHIFEQQPLLNSVWSDLMQVFHRWRVKAGQKVVWFYASQIFYRVLLCVLIFDDTFMRQACVLL